MTKNKTEKPTTSPAPRGGGESRSRTRERRMEKQQQKRRQQQLTLIIGVVAVVVIAAIIFIVSNLPEEAPIPEGVVERYAGIPQTFTDEGYPLLGSPDAPVLVEEYSSFGCPACKTFHDTSFDDIIQLVREGRIAFAFAPAASFGSLNNREGAAEAAMCASEQGRFFEYHDVLFDWHSRYANRAFLANRLISGAAELGLDQAAFESCLNDNRYDEVVNTATTEVQGLGSVGTPAVVIDGVQVATDLETIRNTVERNIATRGVVPVPLAPAGETEPTPVESATNGAPETTPAAAEETSQPEATAESTDEE
ncbi:MAG: thioredoxin domain-containing protein [bacterium]|nr:thioredoxin domain-containing protein [bacterium]